MVILLTSIGKRIELISHLKEKARVVGVDCSLLNPAKEFTDSFYLIPRADEPGYIDSLIEICDKEKPDYIIPLYEGEFDILNDHRDEFTKAGTILLLSGSKVISICKDKFATAEFFEKYDIPAPKTYDRDIEKDLKNINYPVVVKPHDGMGSEGVHIAHDEEELLFYVKRSEKPIVQERLAGREFTVDVLCDGDGNIIYLVPRVRLEVRGGEVSKSRIEFNENVESLCRLVTESLNKEGFVTGPLTLQCFLSESGDARMIEINPRFGGGVPLSFAGGADYAGALEAMRAGKSYVPGQVRELTMLRYDSSVFVE